MVKDHTGKKSKNKYTNLEENNGMILDCSSTLTLGCLKIDIPELLFENTNLLHAKLPGVDLSLDSIQKLAAKKSKDQTYTCQQTVTDLQNRIKSQTNSSFPQDKSGSAVPLKIKNEPCASYLTFKTRHERDTNLVMYLTAEDKQLIAKRLLWTAFSLIGTFTIYLLYGSFRGSHSHSYEAF